MSDAVNVAGDERLVRLREVQSRCGQVSKSTIYSWIKKGSFPAPLKIGAAVAVWRSTDIDSWLRDQFAK